MKIPILYIPKTRFKKSILFEKKYFCSKEIIPIGCDCHPAYTLQKLNIRKRSLPFDWLNTDSIKGVKFVCDNIGNNFSGFLTKLYKNERGYIVSEKFPYAEFMHEKNLISSEKDKTKFIRRISKFLKLIKKDVYFLYNITSDSLISDETVKEFFNSVIQFQSFLKQKQFLCVYIRYDETFDENSKFCEKLLELLNDLKNVNATKYIREKEKEGIWGNEKKYTQLYRSLGIKIYLTFPKVTFVNFK
ncbi:DUF1796 family putative cysteine peptidase [Winogradskyella sp. ECml5-4]|uniref:DUF1796 family putative cysteine peptidase n=1 Tax=Winogradskyella sp. ECml5-4 TaxID=3110975 RepID=UPI002FF3FCAB